MPATYGATRARTRGAVSGKIRQESRGADDAHLRRPDVRQSALAGRREHDLDRVLGGGALGEVPERGGKLRFCQLRLDRHPGSIPAKKDEVDLVAGAVAEIPQANALPLDVGGPVDGAEEVERDHVLEPGPL